MHGISAERTSNDLEHTIGTLWQQCGVKDEKVVHVKKKSNLGIVFLHTVPVMLTLFVGQLEESLERECTCFAFILQVLDDWYNRDVVVDNLIVVINRW